MNTTYRKEEFGDGAASQGQTVGGGPTVERIGVTPDPDPLGARAADDQSIGGLLRQLGREIPSLLTKEVALLKAEARESVRTAGQGVAAVSSGGAVMLAGLVILLLAAVYALSNVLAPWAAALIVGALALLVGYMMVAAGRKKFSADELRPEHSINTLHKDKDAIGGRMS